MSMNDYLYHLATEGRLSRREFMSRAAALGVSTALATSMADKAFAQTPKQGGSFRVALGHGATTDTLDPANWPDNYTGLAAGGSLSNSLTEIGAKGEILPDLAESFEASDDVKTWIFKLRKGSTFHNGKPVTPDDVIASFRHHTGEASKSAVKPLLEAVAEIKADGPDTVAFTLKDANADFPYLVSDIHFAIMPAKDGGGADWESGVRTGPYSLEKF